MSVLHRSPDDSVDPTAGPFAGSATAIQMAGRTERALDEKQRPGAAEVLDNNQKQADHRHGVRRPSRGRARWDGPLGG